MFVGGCVRKFSTDDLIDDIRYSYRITTDQIKEKFKRYKI